MRTAEIRREFFKGNHRGVVRETVDSARPPRLGNPEITPVVGSLTFLGRTDEAEALFRQCDAKGGLSERSRISSRFFLGIARCRHSHYPEAIRYFVENLRALRRRPDPLSGFYVYQGVGFFHYFSGRLKSALRASARAFEHALGARFLYGKALAADLKGHSLVQTGQVALGLHVLEEARGWAEGLGADWLREAIDVSILTYKSRFGWEKSLEEVKMKIAGLSRQDSYSAANLLLELGQGYALRGRCAEAREALNSACQIVYASQNRRQEATLNLRYAYLHYLSGDPYQALNLVRNTVKTLDPRVDRLLRLKALGVERFLSARLGMMARAEDLSRELDRLTRAAGEGIAARMLRRQSEELKVAASGEDRVAEIKDRILREGEGAIETVLDSGYLVFLYDVVRVRPGERLLCFDLVPGSLTIFDEGTVEHMANGVTPILRALAAKLAGRGEMSKKRLIEEVWGYVYHPLRHDGLVYAAVGKLRRMLGERAYWIEAVADGYRLSPRVAVRFPVRAEAVPEAPALPERAASLNHRQLRILRYLARNEFVDTPTCLRLFRCSEITASRDLSLLFRRGLVARVGQARATKYTRRFTNLEGGG